MLIENSSGENNNLTGHKYWPWTTKDSRTAKRNVGNGSVEAKSIERGTGRKQKLYRYACMPCRRYDCHAKI
jgi:hypothetical protein